MLNNKNLFFTLTIIFAVLFIAAFGYFFIADTLSMKSVPDSVISLNERETLKLNRGWEAFTDEDLKNKADVSPDIFGFGEYYYKLIIDTENMQGSSAFLVNPVYSSYEITVNNELIARAGMPSGRNEQLPLNRSTVIPYEQTEDRLEIIFHVANFSHRFGGSMLNWLSYGRYPAVETRSQQGRLLDALIVFGLISISIIHIFNYFYQRRYPYSMYIFLYMFIFMLYALFSGRVLAAWVIPVMNGGFVYRMEEVLLVLALPILMNYIRSLFPDELHSKVVLAVQIAALVFAVLTFAVPRQWVQLSSVVYIFIRLAAELYLFWRMFIAVRNGRNSAKATLISFSVMALCMINDALYTSGLIPSVRLTFVGVFIFAVQQTFRLIIDNITYNRQSEATFTRLEAITRQRDSFISRNSVELDKPIRNIVELGESLLKGSMGPLNSEQIASSSLIVSNGVRLSNMVNDILDFTRIKDDMLELELTGVDFFKVSRKVLNTCEALVAIQELELKSEVERDTKQITADEKRFEQIIYNIVSNSIRHVEKGLIVISGRDCGDVLEIAIRVEGSDLDVEAVKTLFHAYDESMNEGLDEQNATDLSLAIARKLIDLHGAEIVLESEDNVFTYKFSMRYWTGESMISEEEALELDALINLQPVLDEITSDRNIEILIGGKDVEELQILKSQLSSMNYSVVPMMTGRDLLNRVKEDLPHLIVIDVKLPDMSGYEVCMEIRKQYSKDELPVILVINKEDISEMMEGLTSGANDFLTRPYFQEEFLTRVNTHLQLARISNVYSRFVPTEFLNSLGQENIVDVELGDQVSREMTILFVDIRAFTNLSENMTPEENFKFINSYLSRFSPMITNNGGFVDKYIGDAIMALFPHKPEDALAAAKEMIEHVNVYNGHRANCGYKPINIGIGIHTGNMILGIIGDEKRMQGTVISDAVNLASRIQDVTKLYKANVVISNETFVKLENPIDYNFRFLGRVKVKGKDKAVALFEIFDADNDTKRVRKNNTKADFEEALMKFSKREFAEAQDLLEKVSAADPGDQTARVFLERIDEIRRAEKKAFLTSL